METSKEELQSLNEELTTTNTELSLKLNELNQVNSHIQNLMQATEIATIFLDKDLRIFNFTPAVSIIIDLLQTDIGRPFKQFTNNLKYDTLINDAKEVLKTLIPKEVEVQTNDNNYFWMRINPYRTIDDKIDGIVITFTDITEKKKAENIIAQQKLHLQAIVENTDEMISLRDCDDKLVYFNTAFNNATKELLNIDAYKGLNTIELLPKEHREYLSSIVKEVKKGEKHESEHKWDFGNENIRYYKTLLNPIKSKGKVTGYNELTIDITKDKKQKIELERYRNHLEELVKEKSKELYTAFDKLSLKDKIIDDALDGYNIINEKGLFTYANKAYLRMWGFENQAEVIETSPKSHCLDPDMPKKIIEKVEKYGSGEFEFKAKRKDNTIFDVYMRVSSYTDENGKKYYHGFSHDITENNKAKKKILKQQKLLKDAEQLVQIGSWEWDVENDIVNWSEGLFKIFKRSPKLGAPNWTNHSSIFVKEDFEKFAPLVEESVQKGTPFEAQLRAIRSDGEIINCISRGRAEKDKNGKVFRLWGVFVDNTAIAKAKQELTIAKEKAEESDRLKSSFLANMSHELRTPMNGILGFTNLLQQKDLTGKERAEFVEIIEQSGNRMLNTVNDIIEVSKIDSGQIKVSITEVNIGNTLKSLHVFFSLEAKKKGLKLILNNKLSEDETTLLSDETKLSSILTNLIKNAIKFTEKGTIEIGCQKKKDFLEFYVKDSGIGIPAKRKKAIFNRFEQADIEDKNIYQGSGLGLAITKSYVEILGGKIKVESIENKGSTFYVSIPYNPVKTKKSVKKQTDNKIKKLNILVVEDDNISSLILLKILEGSAKTIQTVKNGLEAVEVCKNNSNFDLILMDIKLPGLNGIEVIKRIRQFNTEVKIIIQTAHAFGNYKEKAFKVGCDDYISKPIKKELLFEKIQQCFR